MKHYILIRSAENTLNLYSKTYNNNNNNNNNKLIVKLR